MTSSGDDNQDNMNPTDGHKKVVEFTPRPVLSGATVNRARELLNAMYGAAMVPMMKLLTGLFETTDDSLFDRTDRAQDSDAQSKFFEAMREVRRKRPSIEKMFQDQLRASFSDYSSGKTLKPATDDKPAGGEDTLSLVDESQLEESLALDAMTGRADTRYAQLLYHLAQRCAALVPKQKPEDLTPLSPRVICDAFGAACKELQVSIEIKLIVMKLFERKVVDSLEAVYVEANRVLVDAGILPQLRYVVPKGFRGSPMAPGAPGQQQGMDGAGPDGAGGMPGMMPGQGGEYGANFQQLSALIAAHRQANFPMSPAFAALPITPEQQLLDAVSLLQGEFASLFGSDHQQLPPVMLANQLKQSLLQQVSKLTGGAKQRINAADEDAIDLVGMLFDFVLGDRNLPAQVQAILARLQVPYLKVALLDRHLFSQRHHPARRLLDEMAQACVGWTDEGDRDGRMIAKVREVVESLLANFEQDLGIFEKLHEDFVNFLGQQRRRSEIAEQRTAETALGRERLEAARIAATKAVHARTAKRALPEVVREIITGPWSKLLEVTHARKGSESGDWVGALKFMDDLLWTIDIRQIASDETRWHQLKPEVESQLQQGLQLVGYHSEDVHRLISRLRTHYGNIAAGAQPEPESSELDTGPIDEAASAGVVEGLEITGAAPSTPSGVQIRTEVESAIAEGMVTAANEHLMAVRQLKVGTWIEFVDPKGAKTRAKLSWVSPISEKYLFVNQNGVKIAEKSIYDFAADVKEDRAIVLQQAPLFDRALDAIMRRLRAPTAAAPAKPAAPVPKPA